MNILTTNMHNEDETPTKYSNNYLKESTLNYSPKIRKNLPQTSILVSTGKVSKKTAGIDSTLFNDENDFEILTLPTYEKLVVSKGLYTLYKEIFSLYPHIKVKKDKFDISIKTYKYLYNDSTKKITTIHDVNPDVRSILISKRAKIQKHYYLNYAPSLSQNLKSYQIIDFNNSIPYTLTPKSQIKTPRILKNPEKTTQLPNTLSQKLKTLQEKSPKGLSKSKKPLNFPVISQRSSQKPPNTQSEVLKISAKLYCELMQVPLEASFPLNYSKRFQVAN